MSETKQIKFPNGSTQCFESKAYLSHEVEFKKTALYPFFERVYSLAWRFEPIKRVECNGSGSLYREAASE